MPRKRRSRRRSFSFSNFARKRKGSRRRSSRGGLGRSFGGFIPAGVLQTAGGAVAGFIAAPMLLDKLPFAQVKTGNGRIIGKAVAGLALGFIARKAGLARPIANAIAVGGLMQAGVDVAMKAMGRTGFAGLGDFDVDGVPSYPTGGDLGMYENYVDLGDYGDGDPMTGMDIDA